MNPGTRFQAVIFDLGSTLIYFQGEWSQALLQADTKLLDDLRSAGLDLDEIHFLQEFRKRVDAYYQERDSSFIERTTALLLRDLLSDLGYPDLPETVIRQALDAMYQVTHDFWRAEADAIPTLQSLQKQGYKLGLISNAGDDTDVHRLIDKANVRPFFDVIVTSAATGVRKPDPKIFHQVLDALNVAPSCAVMVGDRLDADVLGAKNAGMTGIWITRRVGTAANSVSRKSVQPDAVIDTLTELPAVLNMLA